MQQLFPDLLQAYLAALPPEANHETRRLRFLELVRTALGIDLGQVEVEVLSPSGGRTVALSGKRYPGKIDSLYGDLVIEFKRSLAREMEDATVQLTRYLNDLHAQHPSRSFTGVATDGLRILAFVPDYSEDSQVTGLRPVGEVDLATKGLDPVAAFLWLDSLFSNFRDRRPATTQSIVAGLGPSSPAFQIASGALARLHDALSADPALNLRYSQWQRYLALVYGDQSGDHALFLRHTYLATVARLVAYLRLSKAPMPSDADLEGILLGRYFDQRASLANFVEEDFFTWPLQDAARKDGIALLRRLLNTLQGYDFSNVQEDVLKELYQGLVDPETRHDLGEYYTPDWLAELMLGDELGLDKAPRRSLLDPSCGSGTFLFTAIRLMRAALEREGMEPSDILLHILEHVAGMDVHPLAVTIARTNYLLALGDLLQVPRGDVTIPVYLADAIKLPEAASVLTSPPRSPSPLRRGGQEERSPQNEGGSFAIEAGERNQLLQIPYALANDPAGLDYLLPFMKGKYAEPVVRARADGSQLREERAWSAFRNFLETPTTSRKPFVLSPGDAEVVVQTQQLLVNLMQQGKDHLWFFILRNSLRPIYLRQRAFDLVVGNPPWLSLRYIRGSQYYQWVRTQALDEYEIVDKSKPHLFTQMEMATLFFARAADLYLNQGGRIAFVMPRSVMVAQQHAQFTKMVFKRGGLLYLGLEKVIDLEGVSPLFNVPTCVLVAQKGKWPAWPVPGETLSGDLVVKNASLDQARPKLTFQATAYQRVEGRLVSETSSTAKAPRGRSYYYDKFYQGATLVPRNIWFVHPVVSPLGFNQATPFFETDPEGVTQAKAPWKDLHMQGNVEARFLYATLPSGQLVPFGYTRFSPVILPLVVEGERYALLNADGASERGFNRLAEWLRTAQGHWERLARKDTKGQPKEPYVWNWLNYRNKLTTQSPTLRYKVSYVKSATILCAAVIDTGGNFAIALAQGSLALAGYLADHETYLYETDSVSESYYLQAVLNSEVLNILIKPLQTKGQWGERDIHKRPLQFPIPQYDPQNAVHMRLAEMGQTCAVRVAEVVPELAARYRGIGRLRGEVRRLLVKELAEIDALTRQVLGIETS